MAWFELLARKIIDRIGEREWTTGNPHNVLYIPFISLGSERKIPGPYRRHDRWAEQNGEFAAFAVEKEMWIS